MSRSHNGSRYSLTFVNTPQLSRGSIEFLDSNANAAIKYLADNIRWKGSLDFVVYWDKERILGDYWVNGGPGFAAYGNSSNGELAALTEAISGIDTNGPEFDAGMWVGPENIDIRDYGEQIYIDADPNPLDDDISSRDFLSVFLHESLHGLGMWSNLQHNNSNPSVRPTKFDSLTIERDGQWFFVGDKTQEIYGGPLPLALTGSRDHYSDSLELDIDLMREYGQADKWQISDIDLAILLDLGHDVPKWNDKAAESPEPENYDIVTGSVVGRGKLKGTEAADAFTFQVLDSFNKKGADKIIGFDSSQGDTIDVSSAAFPALAGVSSIDFVSTNSKRDLQ